jgi:hypothetical protein
VIQEAWIGGVSTRRVDNLVQTMGLSWIWISKSQISTLFKVLIPAMSSGRSEIMSPGVPTGCRLVGGRPAGGWFLAGSGVQVNPLRLISIGFAAGCRRQNR